MSWLVKMNIVLFLVEKSLANINCLIGQKNNVRLKGKILPKTSTKEIEGAESEYEFDFNQLIILRA
jgi:hypothetical protein